MEITKETKNEIKIDEYGRVKNYRDKELKGLKLLVRFEPGNSNNGVCANVGKC